MAIGRERLSASDHHDGAAHVDAVLLTLMDRSSAWLNLVFPAQISIVTLLVARFVYTQRSLD